MTSGLDWPERAISINDPANIVRQARMAADPYRSVLERSVEAMPGTVWNYNGGGVWLLGLILQKVSGQPLDQFTKEALFEPLGIKDWEWSASQTAIRTRPAGCRLPMVAGPVIDRSPGHRLGRQPLAGAGRVSMRCRS